MEERITELVLDESKWLTAAMLSALVAVGVILGRRRRASPSRRVVIFGAMNLFYGCTLGVMSCGHILAVSVKLAQGTLQGSPWILFPLGLALAVPSWWLAIRAARLANGEEERWRKGAAALNAWLGIYLLALGLHNGPLAVPAALDIAYLFHSRRAVGWTILTVTVVANLALFIGSLVFLASGQTFEEFSRAY